jgi:signal transduction histidine kinase
MRAWRCLLLPILALTTIAPSIVWTQESVRLSQTEDVKVQSNILFLAIDDFTRPYMRLMFESFTDAVLKASNPPAIYFESLDAPRFEAPQYLENLRDWLSRKYRARQIDLIVTIAEEPLRFLAAASGKPWPDAQILYFESGNIRVDIHTLPRVGGFLLDDHFPAALNVLKAVLPETRHVALLYGASASEATRFDTFADKVRAAGLEPIELVGLTTDQAAAAVSSLPSQTVIVLLGPWVDAHGKVLSPTQVCELVAAVDRVPVITPDMTHLGCGALGGLMRDWSIAGRRLGEEALARLKYPSNDVVTIPIPEYTTIAFDDRQLLRWNIPERRLPQGAVVRFREPNFWRDRRGLVVTVAAVTLLQSLLIVGLVFERRRRRQAEIDSRRNLAALAHLDRRAAMGELATSLAHELNQPLNAILQNAGMAQMMLTSGTVPAELSEMTDIIGDIRKDDMRASEIIRRMRGMLQKHELEVQPVDLNDVTQETVAIVRPDARSRQIAIEVELVDGIRPILGDRVHLQQVLLNFLMNAMDAVAAMPPERQRVRVTTIQSDGAVRLAVSDTGPGIPADQLLTIFEPFYTTKRGGGMGMGLAIARSIVDAHDGRIAAENNGGGGATVWFTLPIPSHQGAMAGSASSRYASET